MTGDGQLLRRYASEGDAEAFTAILRRHQGLVYGTCLRVLGNRADAEDAAQECFFRLARHAASIHSSLTGWLHTCAMHVSLNASERARARQKREKVYGQSRGSGDGDAESEVTWREVAPIVDEALEELPEELRLAVIERFLQQRTQADVAEELGVSRATLSRRLEAGIASIRKKLRGAGILASVAALTILLDEHASVAAPASLVYQLGKLAIAGLRPIPVAAWPQQASSKAEAAVSAGGSAAATAGGAIAAGTVAKAVAIVLATGILAVALGVGLSWYLGGDEPAGGPAGQAVGDGVAGEETASGGGRSGRGIPAERDRRGGRTAARAGAGQVATGAREGGRESTGPRRTEAAGVARTQPADEPMAAPPMARTARSEQWILVPARGVPSSLGRVMKWTLVPVSSVPDHRSGDGDGRADRGPEKQDDPNGGPVKGRE